VKKKKSTGHEGHGAIRTPERATGHEKATRIFWTVGGRAAGSEYKKITRRTAWRTSDQQISLEALQEKNRKGPVPRRLEAKEQTLAETDHAAGITGIVSFR